MGIFKKREIKSINESSRMVDEYPAFFEYYENNRDSINARLSQCDNNTIEFRLPVLTFGNVMGQLYLGITDKSDSLNLYTYAISRSGRKTQKFFLNINSEFSLGEIEEYVQELMSKIIIDPVYRKITTGRI